MIAGRQHVLSHVFLWALQIKRVFKMTSSISVRILVLLALASRIGPVDGQRLTPADATNGKLASVKEADDALHKVLTLKGDSYHVFLREASLVVPPTLKGRSWSQVQKLMKKHAFVAVEGWDNGDYIHSYHLLRGKFVTFASGHSLDLYLLLSGRSRRRTVSSADVALVASINAPYPEVVVGRRYPEGSVLDAILRYETVKEAGDEWPLLKNVYVHYGYVFDRWRKHNPSGFHVTVEFTASIIEEIGGKEDVPHRRQRA